MHKIKIIIKEKWKFVYIDNEKTKYLISSYGNLKNSKNNKYIKKLIDKDGYIKYHISHKNKEYNKKAHRLVAEAFIPNPLNYPQVNHKDENKQNNYVGNLEWCSQSYNINYSLKRRKNNKTCKRFKKELVIKICKLIKKGYSNKNILIKLNLKNTSRNRSLIISIRSKRNWNSISNNFF